MARPSQADTEFSSETLTLSVVSLPEVSAATIVIV
jgi:hypothetical protein